MLTSNNKINVLLCVYDPKGNYSRHAAVVMTSIFMNTTSNVCIYILHDNTLNNDNYLKLQATADKFNQETCFINIGNKVEQLFPDVDSLTRHYSRGTLFRLFIQDIPIEVERVIYLDCDIVVQTDIKDFWDSFSGQYTVAALHDNSRIGLQAVCDKRMGLDPLNYFCAGVMIFNLNKLRIGPHLADKAKKFFDKYGQSTLYPDQDFLNLEFKDNWQKINPRFSTWDYCSNGMSIDDIMEDSTHIWHLLNKPWSESRGLPTEVLYWHYYSNSIYGKNVVIDMSRIMTKTYFKKIPHGHYEWLRWIKGCIIWPAIPFRRRFQIFRSIISISLNSRH